MLRTVFASFVALVLQAVSSAAVVETTRATLSIGPEGAVRPHMILRGAAGESGGPSRGAAFYPNVYPGIGVEYYFRNGEFEYDFHISPGADPSAIRLAFPAAKRLRIDAAI